MGHVAFKATEVNNHLIKKCLHVNSMNIVQPTNVSVTEEIENAFGELRNTLATLHGRAYKHSLNEAMDALDTKLEEYIIPKVEADSPSPDLPTIHDIRKLKLKYKGLVFTPLDKNTGCMFLCCQSYGLPKSPLRAFAE